MEFILGMLVAMVCGMFIGMGMNLDRLNADSKETKRRLALLESRNAKP